MAFSKKELFTLLPQLVAGISKGLSHPARVRIILYLLENGDTRFQDLAQIMPLHQSTISQHLRMLKRHKVVDVHEKPPHTYYDLNKHQMRLIMLIYGELLHQMTLQGIDPKDIILTSEDDESE